MGFNNIKIPSIAHQIAKAKLDEISLHKATERATDTMRADAQGLLDYYNAMVNERFEEFDDVEPEHIEYLKGIADGTITYNKEEAIKIFNKPKN